MDQTQHPLSQFSSLQCACLSSSLQVHTDKEESLLLDWDRVRVFDREIAQMFLNMTKLEKEAWVCFLCFTVSTVLDGHAFLFFMKLTGLLGQMNGSSHIHS